jgi:hypothetical protein
VGVGKRLAVSAASPHPTRANALKNAIVGFMERFLLTMMIGGFREDLREKLDLFWKAEISLQLPVGYFHPRMTEYDVFV